MISLVVFQRVFAYILAHSPPFSLFLECRVLISIATNSGLAFPVCRPISTSLSPFLSSPRRLYYAAAYLDHGIFRLFFFQNV
jgi:hypothetical protein